MMKKVCGSSRRKDDRITHLPEPLRSKVISFLPMEDAIRASVLSREWRSMTATLPNVEFDQEEFEERGYDEKQFRNIVDRLLLSRDRVDVERFSLFVNCDDDLAPLYINAWILFAIRNNVREFHLNLGYEEIFKLPCCFFQCPTLTDLHLVGEGLVLQVPPAAVLARLKRCTLLFFKFKDDTFTRKLFCCCPSIEELHLGSCDIMLDQNSFTVVSPNLKILTLDFNSGSTEIIINAKNLQQIEYRGTHLPSMSSETLSSLLKANFASVTLSNQRDYCGGNAILFGLRNVLRLSLCAFYIESISRDPYSLERLASCSSLRHLELEISPIWRHVNVVLTLLKIYNKLVTLSVSFQINLKTSNIADDQQIHSDKLMLEHLNTVELEEFGGSNEELQIVRYILENSSSLEKMKIKYALKNNATTRMVISEVLVNVTKASARATILFD